MDILVMLPAMLLGMIFIVIVPFAVIISIFLKSIEGKSKGLLSMLAGFLLMCMGYLFMFVIAISWSGSSIVSTAITTNSLVLEANYMALALFSIPVVWIAASIFLMRDGYNKFKNESSGE